MVVSYKQQTSTIIIYVHKMLVEGIHTVCRCVHECTILFYQPAGRNLIYVHVLLILTSPQFMYMYLGTHLYTCIVYEIKHKCINAILHEVSCSFTAIWSSPYTYMHVTLHVCTGHCIRVWLSKCASNSGHRKLRSFTCRKHLPPNR